MNLYQALFAAALSVENVGQEEKQKEHSEQEAEAEREFVRRRNRGGRPALSAQLPRGREAGASRGVGNRRCGRADGGGLAEKCPAIHAQVTPIATFRALVTRPSPPGWGGPDLSCDVRARSLIAGGGAAHADGANSEFTVHFAIPLDAPVTSLRSTPCQKVEISEAVHSSAG
jgi:hypothetical protein